MTSDREMISFYEAYRLTLENIQPLESENIGLLDAEGRIVAQELSARVDSPSLDVSLKDGYAVLSADIHAARADYPVELAVIGQAAAGGSWDGTLKSGQAVRILSGAPVPQGADAVIAEEFTRPLPGGVQVFNVAEPGRNILPRGTDLRCGGVIVPAGSRLNPPGIGLLAAAGYQKVPVIRRPRVAILATGDEVLAPGQPLVQGKLYASNLFTLAGWCRHYGFDVQPRVLKDEGDLIRTEMAASLETYDAVLTSGGSWKSERDLVVHILDGLGWRKIYHRVRIGPGKAIGFGLFDGKPVFCLPGGPPSNHMAFLQLALPGLLKLAGDPRPGLPQIPAVITEDIRGQIDWTQFVHGSLHPEDRRVLFHPLRYRSRLQEMAVTAAVAAIPEGQDQIPAGSTISVQVLDPYVLKSYD